jgi:hypothetical protein
MSVLAEAQAALDAVLVMDVRIVLTWPGSRRQKRKDRTTGPKRHFADE